jgi:hypothetical protein
MQAATSKFEIDTTCEGIRDLVQDARRGQWPLAHVCYMIEREYARSELVVGFAEAIAEAHEQEDEEVACEAVWARCPTAMDVVEAVMAMTRKQ